MPTSICSQKAGIKVRTGQVWARRLREDPEYDLFERLENRRVLLKDEYKTYLISYFDKNPLASRQEAVENLTKAFNNCQIRNNQVGSFLVKDCRFTISRLTVANEVKNTPKAIERRYQWATEKLTSDADYQKNCVFIDDAKFIFNERRAGRLKAEQQEAAEISLNTEATHIVLGAISVRRVFSIETRNASDARIYKTYKVKE
ncbi:hypothetical protein BY458DRAFT_506036 [Sporodiniella umbellata]|nr:hypothetical protein BY458DRAFT_506036 [Sporodiniella umbellata]